MKVNSFEWVSSWQTKFRHMTAICAGYLLRNSLVDEKGALAAAEQFLDDGYGLIMVINHFFQRDGLQVVHLLFNSSTMRQRPIVAPVALHHHGATVRYFANKLDLQLQPIVTDGTIRFLGDEVNRGDGLAEYFMAAIECLRQGGIVLVDPQASRQITMGLPTHQPMGSLMAQAKRCGVNRLALMFIGLGLRGATDYTTDNAGGFNIHRVYELRLGETLPADVVINLVGGRRYVDGRIFEYLRQLVPVAYGGTSNISEKPDHVRHRKHQPQGESVYETTN